MAGFLFVASARVWGKRHLYLLGIILIIISSAWGGAVGVNYESLLWARIVQGIGLAPFEALVNASVGDLYFVHVSCIEVQTAWYTDTSSRNVAREWHCQTLRFLVAPSLRQ